MCQRLIIILLFPSLFFAQRRVDPKYTYSRVIAIVPIVGSGTASDPRRPQYAPLLSTGPNQAGIIGYMQQLSNDGKLALVEFVARDRSAFSAILADKTIKVFIKGKDKERRHRA
jgi:hypothetical protein